MENHLDATSEPDLLSECLRDYIDDSFRSEGETADAGVVIERLVKMATSSLEGFAPADSREVMEFWTRNPEHWKWAVDEHYSRETVNAIPAIVERFLSLKPVLAGRVPSAEVSLYLREATRCYLYGFFQGSTALCRAALEAGINELLQRRFGNVSGVDLVEKLRQLERFHVLDAATSNDAHAVRKAGGSVLHRSPTPVKEAFDTLVKARAVLVRLYKS